MEENYKNIEKLTAWMPGRNDSKTDKGMIHVFVMTVEIGKSFTIDPQRYSSWLRLKRVLAWVHCFIDNCQMGKVNRISEKHHTNELRVAEVHFVKEVQYMDFNEDWTALS